MVLIQGQQYQANWAETLGDFAVSYGVPSVAIYCVWQRRLQYFVYLGILIVTAYTLRAVGRAVNPSYTTFLQILFRAQKSFNTENAELLRRYDFEFKHWPVSYRSTKFSQTVCSQQAQSWGGVQSTISFYVGWLVAHTFGIRLIYPGLLFASILRSPLEVRFVFFWFRRYSSYFKLSKDQVTFVNILNSIFYFRTHGPSILWIKMVSGLALGPLMGIHWIRCSLIEEGNSAFIIDNLYIL